MTSTQLKSTSIYGHRCTAPGTCQFTQPMSIADACLHTSATNESIHRAPVHSQQEYIATGLACTKKYFYRLYTGLTLCIVKWGILAQG